MKNDKNKRKKEKKKAGRGVEDEELHQRGV
jgi:hypothetical protein